MNSVTEVSAISWPRPMTIRWSAVSSISLIRWEETKTVRPSAARCFISCRIQRMPSGSRPLTGSSKISTCGSPSSAAAMPSRWPMPSENRLDRLRATSLQADDARAPRRRGARGCRCCGQRSEMAAGGAAAVDGLRVQQGADLAQRRAGQVA